MRANNLAAPFFMQESLLNLSLLVTITFFAITFLIFEIYVVIIGHLKGAPFVRSSRKKIEMMVAAAKIKPGEIVIDLGSGDGTLLIESARHGAKAIGVDINPFLVWYSRIRVKWARFGGRVKIFREDFCNQSLKDADVVFLYLWPQTIEKLTTKLVSELKPGARVVSNAFPIPGWTPLESKNGVFLYRI